jgi:hypothetical protein
MRCDEMQEHIINFVYNEGGAPPANNEILAHLRTCTTCREELRELRQTRKYLQLWKDEPPTQSCAATLPRPIRQRDFDWKYLRYAAIAAMVVITILAVANMQIVWSKNGFSFSTRLFPSQQKARDYYTKTELRTLLKEALDDSESRTNEMNYLMIQKMLDTVEQDRWIDLRLIRNHSAQNNNRN